jgi:hypothetical protein
MKRTSNKIPSYNSNEPKDSTSFNDHFFLKMISIVCLLGAFSQWTLSFKIIFVDKEFPTLALSLVFAVVFSFCYLLFSRHSNANKRTYIVQSITTLLLSIICFAIMIFFFSDKNSIVCSFLLSSLFSCLLPFGSLITLSKEGNL